MLNHKMETLILSFANLTSLSKSKTALAWPSCKEFLSPHPHPTEPRQGVLLAAKFLVTSSLHSSWVQTPSEQFCSSRKPPVTDYRQIFPFHVKNIKELTEKL